ncbi:MAG TPA: hypothetical protein VF139_02230 [Candidatus Polarisedimenticolaceae bacterium]
MTLATLCLLAVARTVAVPLAYAPPKDAPAVAAPAGLAPFSLAIADDRGAAPALGTKTRDKDVTTVTTETDLAAFAAEALAGALRAQGATIESGAPHRLEGRLLRADVEESWGYTARVRVAFTLKDAGGARWEKTITGLDKRGSLYPSGEEYSSILSAAAHDLAAKLLAEEAFLGALGAATSKPAPVAVEAPAAAAPVVVAVPAPSAPADGLKTPEAMFAELQRLSKVLDPPTVAAWVSKQRLTRALTVDEIVAWRGAGIPNEAVRAAIDLAP